MAKSTWLYGRLTSLQDSTSHPCVHHSIFSASAYIYAAVQEPPTLAAKFQTLASSSGPGMHQTISLRFMAETRKICAIMRSGDVIVVPVEDEGAPVCLSSPRGAHGF